MFRSGPVDESALRAVARRVGQRLRPGDVVYLSGDLGAGKTTFADAVCETLGVGRPATSPTYALVHVYETPAGPVLHVDCYRVQDPLEVLDLDLDAFLDQGAVALIEWPERALQALPPARIHVRLRHTDDESTRGVEVDERSVSRH